MDTSQSLAKKAPLMIDALEKIDYEPFLLSFKLASVTTIILLIVSLPFAWYLSQTKSKFKPLLESLATLPIVLPPSVLGFYLLILLAPDSAIGLAVKSATGSNLLFSFEGLVVASCIYSMPFMIQPLQSGFESLNKPMIEASYIGGKSQMQTLMHVALPNIIPSLVMALIITFAHTVGEFGVVLMIGGSIAGETKVASVEIYELVENMQYTQAHLYSFLMLTMSFLVLFGVYLFRANSTIFKK